MYRKRQLLLCVCLLFIGVAAMAQRATEYPPEQYLWSTVSDLRGYRVEFRTVDESCPDAGGVEFRIVNDNTGAPITQPEFESLHLSHFRISRKDQYQQSDTNWHHTELPEPPGYDFTREDGWQYVQVGHGTYRIQMSCVHAESFTRSITVVEYDTLTIDRSYVEPQMAIMDVSHDGITKGCIPSLDCAPTGRIQLQILGGGGNSFPDTIHMHNADSSIAETFIFQGPMYSGTDSSRYDYMYNYTFENLGSDTWYFDFTDNCHQHIPYYSKSLNAVSMPVLLDYIKVHAFSGNISDENVIKVKAVLDSEYEYYIRMFAPYMEYAFEVRGTGHSPNLQDTVWKKFPMDNSSKEVTFSDTVERARSYCELWDKQIRFHFRIKGSPYCNDTAMYRTFYIKKPDKFIRANALVQDSLVTGSDPCSAGIQYLKPDNFEIYYDRFDKNYTWSLPNPSTGSTTEGSVYRYHITYPLLWSYSVDLAGDQTVIKTDTIEENFTTEHSVITYEELKNFYETGGVLPNEVYLTRTLTDANNCPVYEVVDTLKLEQVVKNTNGPQWQAKVVSPSCPDETRSITLTEQYSVATVDNDSLLIEMFESPGNNIYNFTALYSSTHLSWTIHRQYNTSTVNTTPDGRSLVFSGKGLPSGYYKFRISNAPCGADTVIVAYMGGIVTTGMSQNFGYEVRQTCTDEIIKITKGAVATFNTYISNSSNVNPNKSNDPYYQRVDTFNLPTKFKLVGGPLGGYDPYDNTVYSIGDSLIISFPTTPSSPYKIRIYPDKGNHKVCEDFDTVVNIYYYGKTLGFDFATALLCDHDDTIGTAYVKPLHGLPPYRLTFFSGPDMSGEVLGVVTTTSEDSTAVFPDKRFNSMSQLSCLVEDSCGWSFSFNFTPQVLAELQLAWFSPNVRHTCEGDSITIYALQYGMIFDYMWTYPDGEVFYEGSNRTIFIPRGADTGIYKVTIHQASCHQDFESSVELKPERSPHVHLSPAGSTMACPGEEVQLSFRAHTSQYDPEHPEIVEPGRIHFKVAFEDMFGITYRVYDADNDETIYDSFIPNSFTKIYPVEIVESVGECTYNRADDADTIYILMNPNQINPCQILTTNALVCQGNDVTLTAKCTEAPPYIIRWYYDYEQTQFIKADTIDDPNEWSKLDLPHLMEHEIRFVSVVKQDVCPSLNNTPNGIVNMEDGAITRLQCSDELMFYDEGGSAGDYPPGADNMDVVSHLFISERHDHTLTIHFDTTMTRLSGTSTLAIFTGSRPLMDSLLFILSNGLSEVPSVVTTNSDTMLVLFTPGSEGGEGWRALVKPSPGIAEANVVMPAVEFHKDWACQSQSNVYTKPKILSLDIADQATLTQALREAGTYVYTKGVEDGISSASGCDSVAELTFVVEPAPRREILGVTTNQIGFKWHKEDGSDSIYREPGVHILNMPDDNGCDRLEILKLVVIDVINYDENVCYGNTTNSIGLKLVTHDSATANSSLIEPQHAIGDLLCWNANLHRYEIFNVDDYLKKADTMMSPQGGGYTLETLPLKPYGVVTFLESNNTSGKAISLVDASPEKKLVWATATNMKNIHAQTKLGTTNWSGAHWDLAGAENTKAIRNSSPNKTNNVLDITKFRNNAPACYYCFYYDPENPQNNLRECGWYLPACGELYFCYAYRTTINETLQKLHDRGFFANILLGDFDDNYWSSSEASDDNGVCINGRGQIILHHRKDADKKNYEYRMRAMYAFGYADLEDE